MSRDGGDVEGPRRVESTPASHLLLLGLTPPEDNRRDLHEDDGSCDLVTHHICFAQRLRADLRIPQQC